MQLRNGKVETLLMPGKRVAIHVPVESVVVGAAYQGIGICEMDADRQQREKTVPTEK